MSSCIFLCFFYKFKEDPHVSKTGCWLPTQTFYIWCLLIITLQNAKSFVVQLIDIFWFFLKQGLESAFSNYEIIYMKKVHGKIYFSCYLFIYLILVFRLYSWITTWKLEHFFLSLCKPHDPDPTLLVYVVLKTYPLFIRKVNLAKRFLWTKAIEVLYRYESTLLFYFSFVGIQFFFSPLLSIYGPPISCSPGC